MKRIAIQGFEGSFHDITAHKYFEGEQLQLVCCATFEEVFDNMKADPTMLGLTAIENTIAGSLLHNYELLRASGMSAKADVKAVIMIGGRRSAEPFSIRWSRGSPCS